MWPECLVFQNSVWVRKHEPGILPPAAKAILRHRPWQTWITDLWEGGGSAWHFGLKPQFRWHSPVPLLPNSFSQHEAMCEWILERLHSRVQNRKAFGSRRMLRMPGISNTALYTGTRNKPGPSQIQCEDQPQPLAILKAGWEFPWQPCGADWMEV